MLGFPAPVPKNGDDFDATPVSQDLQYLLQVLQAYDLSNAQAGTLPDTAFGTSNSPLQRYIDMFQSFIVSGGLSTGFTGLSYSVPAISVAYFASNGKRVPSISGNSFTAAINSDTYLSVNSNGVINTPQVVSNNSPQPTLPSADSQWLQRVVTNGSTITVIYDLRNLSPVNATFSNPHKFSAWASVTSALAAGTWSKITFDKVEYDTGNDYDEITNNRFVAPAAGFYRFAANIELTSGGVEVYTIGLYKNGSLYKKGIQVITGAGGAIDLSISPPAFQLAQNDYVEVYGFNNSGGGKTVASGQANTYFGGYLVSGS